jgi:hypothetical protein
LKSGNYGQKSKAEPIISEDNSGEETMRRAIILVIALMSIHGRQLFAVRKGESPSIDPF